MVSSTSSSNAGDRSSSSLRSVSGWKRSLATVAGIFALGLASVVPARAVSVIPPDFTELVTEATQIVRVRITQVSTRWDDSAFGRVIHTYVEGETLKTLKGQNNSTIKLRLLGGEIGDVSMTIADMPSFEVGQTYILFVAGNGQAFCPLVGVMHGSYPLMTDEATQTQYVARSNRQALSNVDDVALPILTQSNHPALRLNSGAGLATSDFEAAITNELTRANKS